MTQKIVKSKKHIFKPPRQTKNFQYLGPRESDAKMPLLHFVITRHFSAACQFWCKNYGPVSRSWLFFRRSNTYRFFFPERRKGTLPYVANDSCPAQTARPPRCHYGVDIVCIFFNDCGCAAAFAAAPRLCSHNGDLNPHDGYRFLND